MARDRGEPTPEQMARRQGMVLAGCGVFFAVAALVLGLYSAYSHHDYYVRTHPPGGRTTEVVVDDVTVGRDCTTNGKTHSCAPEYTLGYAVDGVRHTTAIRIHLHPGDHVHAFRGSDGRWYVTEDPGFGNSSVAWLIWAASGLGALFFAAVCFRGLWRSRRPGDAQAHRE